MYAFLCTVEEILYSCQMLGKVELTTAEMCLALHLVPTKESFKKVCASLRQRDENMVLC